MNLVWQRIGVSGKNFFARYLEVLEPGPGSNSKGGEVKVAGFSDF